MAIRDEILVDYDSKFGVYIDFTSQITALLHQLITDSDIQLHSITSRVKTRSSLEDKLKRTKTRYKSLSQITDISGIRVTTYFADDVDSIASIVQRSFDVDSDNSIDKRLMLDPDRFGYLSLHYIVSLNQTRRELPEYSRYANLKLEIQIRSILQHAWAEMEHDLGYKSVQAIPREVRRKFARLAGLLELADEQFINIRDSIKSYKDEVGGRIITEPSGVSVNRDSLFQFVQSSDKTNSLDREITRILDYKLIPLSEQELGNDVNLLDSVGIATIEQLANSLSENYDMVVELARHYSSNIVDGQNESPEQVYRGISIFYLWQVLISKIGDVTQTGNLLKRFKIGPEPEGAIATDLTKWYSSILNKNVDT